MVCQDLWSPLLVHPNLVAARHFYYDLTGRSVVLDGYGISGYSKVSICMHPETLS